MSNKHIYKCPVCEGPNLSPYLHTEDYSASHDAFALMQCKDCSFVFTQDHPDEKSIKSYYDSSDYISHSDTKKGIINYLYHLVRKRTLKAKVKLLQQISGIKEKGMLLDIGAGNGYFLNACSQNNWITTGIEKNVNARQFAKDNFGLNMQAEDYLFSIPKNQKDVITLWHVMEHLDALNESFAQIKNILKDDGILIVALPNIDSSDASYYKKYWAAYDVPRHLWHFNPESFARLADKHGFQIIETKPMPFDVFYISMLSERYKNSSVPFLIGGIRGFNFFIKNLLGNQPLKSSSLIYILTKKI